MSATDRPGVAVIKFGGSVLDRPAGYAAAADEVRRQLQTHGSLVAVVSARQGATEQLLELSRALSDDPPPAALSGLLSTGEDASAWLLALALDTAGVENRVIPEAELGLQVAGPRLDGDPVGVDLARLQRGLNRNAVVVVPGFVGRHVDGGPALLGRGGSDLTALYLAHRLGARDCRLVKDVGGLYPSDPKLGGQTTHRYRQADWAEVARVGRGVVQPKALEFAARTGVGFRIAGLGVQGTWIARGPCELERAVAS